MDQPRQPRRFALLIGVDAYHDGSERKAADGTTLPSLNNLQGCVNDVKAIQEVLKSDFQVENPSILTSPPVTPSSTGIVGVSESADRLPTFQNIRREFGSVLDQANAGDFFFFQFSGHGALLEKTEESPSRREKDPSLLTVDYCQGKPAVRGWQLNQWLQTLNEKKVHIVAILDSCYSGGSWRASGHFRTPADWPVGPNLPADEAAAKVDATRPVHRDGELGASWSINPRDFTLMAACTDAQNAAEKTIGGRRVGVFTHALVQVLKQTKKDNERKTYRIIREEIAKRIEPQNPVVYGRDRLLFFGDFEPFSAAPIAANIREDGKVSLPVGTIHGIYPRSEFSSFSASADIDFSITDVSELECRATISMETMKTLEDRQPFVIPSRWSFGEKTLRILVDSSLGADFQTSLQESLENCIASDVEIIEFDDGSKQDHRLLRVVQTDGHLNILGPKSCIGYGDPVRGLDITGQPIDERASQTAIVLSHLARFEEVWSLKTLASKEEESKPFTAELSQNGTSYPGPFPENQQHTFSFKNIGQEDLYLAVISFGPGFNIKQLYPPTECTKCVKGGENTSFFFHIEIPSKLKGISSVDQARIHRDILRVIVTKGQDVSWKSLELPRLWEADQMRLKQNSSSKGRHAKLESAPFSWWVKDIEILTGGT